MTLTVQGLVIRVVPYKDYDKLITVLTKDRGKLFFKANAVRSLVHTNSAACNPFSYSEFILTQKQDYLYLNKAQLLQMPLGYGVDVATLSAASYFGELCDDAARDEEGAACALKLVTNALHVLAKKDRPVHFVKAVFELRFLSVLGFMPQLSCCGECQKEPEGDSFFHLVDGNLLCPACARKFESPARISAACLALARRTVSVEESRAYAVQADDALLAEFCDFAERYLLAQMQRGFATLDFYHAMKDV